LSDGNCSDGDALQPPMLQDPPPMTTQDAMEMVMLKNPNFNVEVPPQFHPSFGTPEFISMDVGLGYGFGGLELVIAGQVAREDLTIVKAKTLSSEHVQKRRIIAFTLVTTISPLNTPLGSGSRLISASRKELQGPLLVDNDLELEADFSLDIVIVMQEGAAIKVRKIIIRRTIGSKLRIKVLNDYLKLHLPTSLVLVILLMHGFFEVLFLDEEGTKATWNITLVEWIGMNFFLFRYVLNFDSNT